MTSILDAATGNDVHVAPDFENLDQMLNYDALAVCLRSRHIDPLENKNIVYEEVKK